MLRDLEREVIPMARAEGMALAPWNVLAAGRIRSDAQEQARRESGEKGEWARSDRIAALQLACTHVGVCNRSHIRVR